MDLELNEIKQKLKIVIEDSEAFDIKRGAVLVRLDLYLMSGMLYGKIYVLIRKDAVTMENVKCWKY